MAIITFYTVPLSLLCFLQWVFNVLGSFTLLSLLWHHGILLFSLFHIIFATVMSWDFVIFAVSHYFVYCNIMGFFCFRCFTLLSPLQYHGILLFSLFHITFAAVMSWDFVIYAISHYFCPFTYNGNTTKTIFPINYTYI